MQVLSLAEDVPNVVDGSNSVGTETPDAADVSSIEADLIDSDTGSVADAEEWIFYSLCCSEIGVPAGDLYFLLFV